MLHIAHATLLLGALVVACSSSSDRAGHGITDNAGDGTERVTAALSASTTLSGALANKIQPITSSYKFISSGLPGKPEAEPDGSASYRLPLWTPDGVNGMQPSLGIEYNSESGTGLLGPRWRLTGLSAITRCKKTRAQDGTVTPINLTGDVFCLDGERLIRLSPTSMEFHPERDNFIKVIGTTDGSGNFTTFTAYQKDGRIFYYGRTPSSRLHGNVTGTSGADYSYAYYVDKMMDRYGNSILITYANAVSSLSNSLANQAQELEPSTITWGGTEEAAGQRSVSFTYESLPSGTTVDSKHMRWVAGLGIGGAQFMTTISIYGPDGTGAAPLLKTYGFTYGNTATASGTAIVTGDRVLSTISECDANGYCKKPTNIQWEAGSNNFTKVDMGVSDAYLTSYAPSFFGPAGTNEPSTPVDVSASMRRFLVADLDNDGRDDIIYRGYVPPGAANTETCLGWIARTTSVSNGTPSFGAPYDLPLNVDPDWTCSGLETNPAAIPSDPVFQDIDGDGYVDIVTPYGASTGSNWPSQFGLIGGYHLYLNTAASGTLGFGNSIGFLETATLNPMSLYNNPTLPARDAGIAIGDTDGDGYPEIIRMAPTSAPVVLPNNECLPNSASPGVPAVCLSSNNQGVLATASFPPTNSAPAPHTTTIDGGFAPPHPYTYLTCTDPNCNGTNTALSNSFTFPDGGTTVAKFYAIDLDGDGIAEVLREESSGTTIANSRTMSNVVIPNMPTVSAYIPNTTWADVNGDGLMDAVTLTGVWQSYAEATGNITLEHATVAVAINTGIGFATPVTTTLPYSLGLFGNVSGDLGVRAVDVNLDGRQDLVFTATYAPYDPYLETTGEFSVAVEPYQQVLLSNGDGTFTQQSTTIPAATLEWDSYSGANIFPLNPANPGLITPFYANYFAPLAAVVADLNGDGLPDFVEMDATARDSTSVHLFGYVRQGSAPEKVNVIAEGNGRSVNFGYAPLVDDGVFYNVDRGQTCVVNPHDLSCVNHGQWAVQSITVGGTDIAAPTQQTFAYTGGVADKNGRGFLGFYQRDIYGPGSQHTIITYDPVSQTQFGSGYFYAGAMVPQTIQTDVNTTQGTNNHHYTFTTNWNYPQTTSFNTFFVTTNYVETDAFDCPSSNGRYCTRDPRSLGSSWESRGFDAYGNKTSDEVDYYTDNTLATVAESDITTVSFNPPNTGSNAMWLVSLPSQEVVTSTVGSETTQRTTNYTEDPNVNATTGLLTGRVLTVEDEPMGDITVHRLRTLTPDSRGRVSSVTDQAGFLASHICSINCADSCYNSCGNSCNSCCNDTYADFENCLNTCQVDCGIACWDSCTTPSQTRTTNYAYEDADGVYVTTTTNALGGTTRVWRHPGLGLVVETDDLNGFAATQSYDTFGRPLLSTEINGATTLSGYQDNSGPGLSYTVEPESKATRQVSILADSWGRTSSQTSPIDGKQTLTVSSTYDAFGRLIDKGFTSGGKFLNDYGYAYDDMNRLLSVCHLATDNVSHCKTNSYDGLSITTTDESGVVSSQSIDTMGHLIAQGVAGIPAARWSYGPFGLLEHESTADGTGETDLVYDVRGRQIQSTRIGAGTRGTGYNPFGDIVESYKLQPDLVTKVDDVSFTVDALGRVTAASGPAFQRNFYWDSGKGNAPPTVASVGKLVEVDNTSGGDTSSVNYFYDSATGQMSSAVWMVSLFGNPTTVGTATYNYDSQGRLSQLTYPQNLGGSYMAFTAQYAYDPYTGTTSSITDTAKPSSPLWQATARNQWGEVSAASLTTEGGSTVPKSDSFNPQDGTVDTSTLANATVTTTYQPNGLTSTSALSGAATWSSTFGYDGLQRLSAWTPASGAPTVSYGYDSDGNLTSRSWSGETAWFSRTPGTALTNTVVQGGTTVRTDTYALDGWGRITSTPAVTVGYNPMDEVSGIVEETNGNLSDAIVHDGFGHRLATTYGTAAGGAYLLTLMGDAYEFKHTGSGMEERCRLRADGKVVGDVVRTSSLGAKTSTFYLTDKVGSVVAEVSDTGAVTARSQRDPFGNLVTNAATPYLPPEPTGTDPDGSSRLGFGDHERDANWGLVDMNARFYSPALGRFISPDSVVGRPSDSREYNPFVYAGNNPATMRDLNGHDCDGCSSFWAPIGTSPGPGGGYSGSGPGGGSGPDGLVVSGPQTGGSVVQFTVVQPNNLLVGQQVSTNSSTTPNVAIRVSSTVVNADSHLPPWRKSVANWLADTINGFSHIMNWLDGDPIDDRDRVPDIDLSGTRFGYADGQERAADRPRQLFLTGMSMVLPIVGEDGAVIKGGEVIEGGEVLKGAEAVEAVRTFTSTDPLVADLANTLEKAYPGHVVGVNVPLIDGTGRVVTDADILLKNAVIQVKSGGGKGLTTQLLNTQSVTDLPVIGYGPNLGGSLVKGIQAGGGLVTRDMDVLIRVVAP